MGLLKTPPVFSFACAIALFGCVGLGQELRQGNRSQPDTSALASPTAPKAKPPGSQPADPSRGDVRIVVISDLNSAYGMTTYEPEVAQAIALIPGWKPDLVLGGGDMIAGQKRELSDAQVRAMWAGFDAALRQPLDAAQIPFGFTMGNHDGSGAVAGGQLAFGRDRDLAAQYWKAVNPNLPFVDRAKFPFYYSFLQNGVFYLVWDASTAELDQQQLKWVEQQLASKIAQTAKARLVIGHLPLYPVAVKRDRPGEFLNNASQLRQLLERYDVHTYISGHNHAYYPGRKGKLELLHAGALGSGPRQLLGSDAKPDKTLTLVDLFWGSGSAASTKLHTVYQTYRLPEMTLVETKTLPAQVVSDYGTVRRRDLEP
jgi:hypothetical protein